MKALVEGFMILGLYNVLAPMVQNTEDPIRTRFWQGVTGMAIIIVCAAFFAAYQ